MFDSYYIDRDPRPKTKPCHFCARDVEVVGRGCTCVPSQPRNLVVTPGLGRPLRFLDEEPDL